MPSCKYTNTTTEDFNQHSAFVHLKHQVALGPRIPGSDSHEKTVSYIENELNKFGWETEIQEFTALDHTGKNIIGKWGEGEPWIIIGTHYDTRSISNRDPDPQKILTPGPGANDGASGVAVLLELARILPGRLEINLHQLENKPDSSINQIWLIFFDLEDNGDISGFDWILGSTTFVNTLDKNPSAAIIVDMIGDSNLNIYIESNSDNELSEEIWEQAKNLGYHEHFIPQTKYSIIDDHIPFLEKGIDAVDIIDFDYAHWHTTQDTVDKVSPDSLKIVGDTLLSWVLKKRFE